MSLAFAHQVGLALVREFVACSLVTAKLDAVDALEELVAFVIDLAQAFIEREAFLGQGYFEFRMPTVNFRLLFWSSRFS